MNEEKNINLPEKCPYCGKDYKTNFLGSLPNSTYGINCAGTYFEGQACIFCNKIIILQKTINPSYTGNQINFIYPSKAFVNLSKEIKEEFPLMTDIFTQALEAKAQNLNHLVGAGLRKALEVLITDYLVKFQNENKEDLLKLTLHKRIEKLDSSLYAKPCAMLAKNIGNDEIHYEKLLDFDIDELQKNLETLCSFMSGKIQIVKAERALAN